MTTVNSTVLNTSKFQREEVINVIKTKKLKQNKTLCSAKSKILTVCPITEKVH